MVGVRDITGTLKHVTGYTGFSGDPNEQEGNYLVLHCESDDANSITVELVGGVSGRGEVTLDADGLIIVRVSNNKQKIVVRAYEDGNVQNTHIYSLTKLVLSGE